MRMIACICGRPFRRPRSSSLPRRRSVDATQGPVLQAVDGFRGRAADRGGKLISSHVEHILAITTLPQRSPDVVPASTPRSRRSISVVDVRNYAMQGENVVASSASHRGPPPPDGWRRLGAGADPSSVAGPMLNADCCNLSRCQWLYRPLAIARTFVMAVIAPMARASRRASHPGTDPQSRSTNPDADRLRLVRRRRQGAADLGAVLAAKPELFLFLGDNVYGDTRDMAVLRAKYAEFARQPGFAKLRDTRRSPRPGTTTTSARTTRAATIRRGGVAAGLPRFWGERWTRRGGSRRRVRIVRVRPAGPAVQVDFARPALQPDAARAAEPGARSYRSWACGRHRKGSRFRVRTRAIRSEGDDARRTAMAVAGAATRSPADLRLIGSACRCSPISRWEAWSLFARDQQRLID